MLEPLSDPLVDLDDIDDDLSLDQEDEPGTCTDFFYSLPNFSLLICFNTFFSDA
jgi:hypothetical protein